MQREYHCLFNKQGTTLTMHENQHQDTSLDDSIMYVDNIMEEFHRLCENSERNPDDTLLIGVRLYLKRAITMFIANQHFSSDNTYHFILTLPNTWQTSYFDFIQEQLELAGITCLHDQKHTLHIIHESGALFRYIQHPSFHHDFKNGDNCIVCFFDYKCTVLYGYEIGRPITGLKNIPQHTTCLYEEYPDDLEKSIQNNMLSYLNSELDNVIDTALLEYCMNLFYEHLPHDNGNATPFASIQKWLTHLNKTVSPSVLKRWTSMTLKELLDHVVQPFLDPVYIKIRSHASHYYDTQIIIMGFDRSHGYKEMTTYFSRLLAEEFLVKDPIQVNSDFNMIFMGSHYTVKDMLRLQNYLPTLLTPHPHPASQSTVHLDMRWHVNYMLHSQGIQSSTMTRVECPSLQECFITSNSIHGSSLRDIRVTKKLLAFIGSYFSIKNGRWARIEYMFSRRKSTRDTMPHSGLFQWEEAVSNETALAFVSYPFSCHQPILRRYVTRLFMLYIECVKLSISATVTSEQFLMSMDRSILDAMLIDEEDLSEQLRKDHQIRWIQREQLTAVYCKNLVRCYEKLESILLYPSYLVQVHMYPTCLHFTLNIVVPLSENERSAQNETVLTLKRRSVPFDIFQALIECLWDEAVRTDSIHSCPKHTLENAYSTDQYTSFMKNMKQCLTDKFASHTGKSDTSVELRWNTACDCHISLTYRDLCDIAILPSVDILTSAIVGTLSDPCAFKDYDVHDMVIMGHPLPWDRSSRINVDTMSHFKKKMKYHMKYFAFQLHYADLPFSTLMQEGVETVVNQPESGLLHQVSSGSYALKIKSSLEAYHDHARTEPFSESIYHAVLHKAQRITTADRENGYALLIHFDCSFDSYRHPGFYGYLSFSTGTDASYKEILDFYTMWRERSFPFAIRVYPQWDSMKISLHCNPDGIAYNGGDPVMPIVLSENVTLSL